MSLQIYIAQTGERLRADPVSFASPEALRSWISRYAGIPAQRQILMSARGKQAKLQTLLTEVSFDILSLGSWLNIIKDEIFVYDRQYLASSPDSSLPVPQTPALPTFTPQKPPDTITDQNNLQSWRNLFMARKSWATRIVDKCKAMDKLLLQHYDQIDVIQRSVRVALENLRIHGGNLENKYENAGAWANELLGEEMSTLKDWEMSYENLDNIKVRQDILLIVGGKYFDSTKGGKTNRFEEYIDLKECVDRQDLENAASLGAVASQKLRERIDNLNHIVENVSTETRTLLEMSSADAVVSVKEKDEDRVKVMEEIETFAKKISSDYEHVLKLVPSPKSVSQASKLALIHTRELLPSLLEVGTELDEALKEASMLKASSSVLAQKHMQSISRIQSMLAQVHQQIAELEVSEDGKDSFDLLNFSERLPVAYGCLLIEAIRRREWSDKITTDSSTIAEELAILRDEEDRRRRKWYKSMDNLLNSRIEEGNVLGIEVNLQGEEHPWPNASRNDLDAYIENLKNHGKMEAALEYLAPLVKELDSPSRHQMRRARAFKNGSIYGAGLRGSLLVRGDDDILRSLRDDKSRLEDKLKGSESRVRKLEDLLHRQGNRRNSGANPFGISFGPEMERVSSPIGNTPSSPHPDTLSRRSSISSRRWSSNQNGDDKALAQRIVALEAELHSEKDRTHKLQHDMLLEQQSKKDLHEKNEESESTKKDLMANLEAQQREFEAERRILTEESKALKAKLEEEQDEIDRLMGSRDQQEAAVHQHILTLQSELQEARRTSTEDMERAAQQIESLKNEFQVERDKSAKLESEVLGFEKALQNAGAQLKEHDGSREKSREVLNAVYAHLAPSEQPPEEFDSLVGGIVGLAEKITSRVSDLQETLKLANESKATLEERILNLETESSTLHQNLDAEERNSHSLRETLTAERARYASLKAELDSERNELNTLRSKFTAGETGSEALKERVAEEERKFAELSEKLAFASSHTRNLEQELQEWKEKVKHIESEEQELKSRLDLRNSRAQELTERVYNQSERMRSMLEHLGYIITHQDNTMVVQRVPRSGSANASTILNDPNAIQQSSSHSGFLSPKQEPNQIDPSLLSWMYVTKSSVEDVKYTAFLDHLNRFDIKVFNDAIIKRVRDVEHAARKWQKEARAYREKSHRFQNEAHDKIAFRSFKEGDLALFLPTRNQATRPWAAFNVGAPHYFLREQDGHKLQSRDWLLARISKVEERVVDLSKSFIGPNNDRRSLGENSDGASLESKDENPFELSDGLRWYLLDAAEEKPGAPTTPGLGKSTVASAHVDAKGSIRLKKPLIGSNNVASKTLTKSLDSRRSSTNSKKGPVTSGGNNSIASKDSSQSLQQQKRTNGEQVQGHQREPSSGLSNVVIAEGSGHYEVRRDELFGP
ncbi:MAG: oligomeric, coiled-coil, peripheral membrane protein [Cirrosporium novae-zelandiae]|nr:MAG: oligomeric, coiled-coil, peripheral membrane protein [Cirrosporium novae-zelandiae]